MLTPSQLGTFPISSGRRSTTTSIAKGMDHLSTTTAAVLPAVRRARRVSLLNDELVVMIPRQEVHDTYVAHVDDVWDHHSKALG